MGVSLKNILNETGEDLSVNKSANAIKALMFLAGIVFLMIIVVVVIMLLPDKDKERREKIINDMKFIQSTIQVQAGKHVANPKEAKLYGQDLSSKPKVITTNGVDEEYRYGYYLLSPEDMAAMTTYLNIPNAVLLPKEYYVVNYDTADVVNVDGVKYNKGVYHTMEDMLIIEKQQTPPVRQIIRTVADLEKIRQNPNGVFKLSGNLDLSGFSAGEGWTPIANFSGTLDGRGYSIQNLTISKPNTPNIGFFAQISAGARVTNLKFTNVNIQGSNTVGVVAGSNNGTLSYITVTTDKDKETGEIVGNIGVVTASDSKCGGLVGAHSNGTISNCTVDLKNVNGTSQVGGLVGNILSGTITKSGATCKVVAGSENVGGAIGLVSISSATTIEQIKSEVKNISASQNVGGLIGAIDTYNSEKLILMNSYAKGAINGTHTNGGGLIGLIRSAIDASIEMKNLYAYVDVVEKSKTSGGAVGYTDISVIADAKVDNCFWCKDIAPGEVLNGVGANKAKTMPLTFISKTPEQMIVRSTYTDWDREFDVWTMEDRVGTPYLKWEKD